MSMLAVFLGKNSDTDCCEAVSCDPSISNLPCIGLGLHVLGLFSHETCISLAGGETDNGQIAKEVRNVMKKINLGLMTACVCVHLVHTPLFGVFSFTGKVVFGLSLDKS